MGVSLSPFDRRVRSLREGDAPAVKHRPGARQRPGKGALEVRRAGVTFGRVEFGILGPLAVWTDGRELALGAPKQRALLARAAAAPQRARADRDARRRALGRAAAGDRGQGACRSTSRSSARRSARASSRRGRSGYLAAGRARRARRSSAFEELLGRGRRAARRGRRGARRGECCAEALGLWRGPALADFRYEAFARDEIGRLEELRLVALEQRLEADLALGRHAEVVPELEALVREHPLRESLRGLLMLALYRSGRQADALAAYQDARAALVDELGLDPGESLQQLEQAILLHDPSLELPVAAAPPAPPPPCRGAPEARADRRRLRDCGTANARGAQFCHSCGASLEPEAPAETRKTVTVLFCDVVDYGELAGRLDPEALRHVMSRFFELAADTIERHGGTIETFVGDEVMAVFGVPAVREDDALRAVRAALELREGVAGARGRRSARARGADRDHDRRGHRRRPRRRARVRHGRGGRARPAAPAQRAAPARSCSARRRTPSSRTRSRRRRSSRSSGRQAGTVRPFRLESLDATATAVPRRADSPLIGRERELDWLRGVFARGRRRRRRPAGRRSSASPAIGKSRFAREFVGRARRRGDRARRPLPAVRRGDHLLAAARAARAGRPRRRTRSRARATRSSPPRAGSSWSSRPSARSSRCSTTCTGPSRRSSTSSSTSRRGSATRRCSCSASAGRELPSCGRRGCARRPRRSRSSRSRTPTRSGCSRRSASQPAVRPRIAEAAEGNPLFVEQLAAIADEYGTAGDDARLDPRRPPRAARPARPRGPRAARARGGRGPQLLARGRPRPHAAGGARRRPGPAARARPRSSSSGPTRPRPRRGSASTTR